MLGDIVGYCDIRKDFDGTGFSSPLPLKTFTEEKSPLRVLEINEFGDILVLNREGTGLASFPKSAIYRIFECNGGNCSGNNTNEPIMPKDLDFLGQMQYKAMCFARKGGFAPILRQMVIQASLMKGKFDDSILWAKQ